MSELPHLDCTGADKRIQICQDYIVHADDCITLYGGMTIQSDANNHTIRDKYYQFSCTPVGETEATHVIFCGSNAARHLCQLTGQQMPHSFNPFVGDGEKVGGDTGDKTKATAWNPLRRKFYYAIQLFITRYQRSITPGTTIFKLRQSIEDEKFLHIAPQKFHYEVFMNVVTDYKTTINEIINSLSKHGNIRNFYFDDLAIEAEKYVSPRRRNIFK